ncbi:MAG: PIG-L family deacetylase [Acidobacteriaceae bacterium]|nr:PIG-L family deacetylase [Acidobacteriaceae bacterium]
MPFRLLCVTAHPDDESGAFGGALLMAHRGGIETHLLCLTDGQAAHHRGEAADSAELGRLRRAELDAACEVLQITGCEVLHYPDGELPRLDFFELAGAIAERIRSVRPQVVLTFGGDGGVNLHRDHTMVSMATTAAFHWAGRREFFPEQLDRGLQPYAPQKLYYSHTPWVMVRNRPELSASPTVPYSLTLELGELAQRKIEAFRKHSTQVAILDRVGEVLKKHLAVERYLLAASPAQIGVAADTTLFEGVVPD